MTDHVLEMSGLELFCEKKLYNYTSKILFTKKFLKILYFYNLVYNFVQLI